MRKFRFDDPKSLKSKVKRAVLFFQAICAWHVLGYFYFKKKVLEKEPEFYEKTKVEQSLIMTGKYHDPDAKIYRVNISSKGIKYDKDKRLKTEEDGEATS